MRIAAVIAGSLLIINCAVCLMIAIVHVMMVKRTMSEKGMEMFVTPPMVIVPLMHVIGLTVGAIVVSWGLE